MVALPRFFFAVGNAQLSIQQMADLAGTSYHTMRRRLLRGVPPERAAALQRLPGTARRPLPPGTRVGALTVQEDLCSREVICRCDCGRLTSCTRQALRRQTTRSCGCRRYPVLPPDNKP